MATILFAVLPQMGHIGPTLEIAASLVAQRHRIVYFANEGFREPIESVGAELLIDTTNSRSLLDANDARAPTERVTSRPSPGARDISDAFEQVQANLLLIDRMLIEYRSETNHLPPAKRLIFSTSLLDWQEPPDVPEDEPLLILCPELLEHPKFRYPRKRLFYTEPAIAPRLHFDEIKADATDQPIVLCAFGTQSLRHTRLAEHYRLVFSLAGQYKGCDFVLAAEHSQLLPDLRSPTNLHITPAVSQRTLLSQCAAFVTHGGLGSIKEAILAGVPTLVLPSFGDQFFNAMRVRYHGIGEGLFEERQTEVAASDALGAMLDGKFQGPLSSMQAHFQARSRARMSLLLIQEALAYV